MRNDGEIVVGTEKNMRIPIGKVLWKMYTFHRQKCRFFLSYKVSNYALKFNFKILLNYN